MTDLHNAELPSRVRALILLGRGIADVQDALGEVGADEEAHHLLTLALDYLDSAIAVLMPDDD